MLSNWYSFQCNSQCSVKTGVEFCWVTQHFQKQISSTLPCTIYCLNHFDKMLSLPKSHKEKTSATNWYSFQCNSQCSVKTGVEFCWVTQHFQKQISSTLPCTIYCLNHFDKMLSLPKSHKEKTSATNWYSFQCNSQCSVKTGVEFCWVTQHFQKQIWSTLPCTIYCLNCFDKMLSLPKSHKESDQCY